MSYPLCVFLESREQGLDVNHPFYRLVEEALQDVIQCPVVMLYMARITLKYGDPSDEVAEKQRVEEIIQYLQNVCPTISGSDSPTMDSTFVEMRAYSGCGEDPKRRKISRKHVYIQKRLVDVWMEIHESQSDANEGNFLLLTFFMKFCLLRGLIAAVNVEFTSDINRKDHTHDLPNSLCATSCSFEHFLSRWSNSWLVFDKKPLSTAKLPYDKLCSIVFIDRSVFSHVQIKGEVRPVNQYPDGDPRIQPTLVLRRLASGNWTAFPPASDIPYNVFNSRCLQMWDSSPAEDPKPRNIEKAPQGSNKSILVNSELFTSAGLKFGNRDGWFGLGTLRWIQCRI